MTFEPDSQKLYELFQQTRESRHWARIFCKDGHEIEAFADCWTWIEDDDGDDLPAMCFVRRDGSLYELTGAEIDRFDILESR